MEQEEIRPPAPMLPFHLGLQLHTRLLEKVHVQPLVERIEQRLLKWKRKWLNKAGRLTLVTSVLSSMPTYHLTMFPLAAWAKRKIDKIRRSFLWKGRRMPMVDTAWLTGQQLPDRKTLVV